MQLTAAVAALLFGSFVAHSAKAQQATYTVTLTNNATYPIFGDYDAPTTTGGMPGIWFSGGLIGQNGGQRTATPITVTPAMASGTSTFFSGTTASAPAPFYVAEYECKYTITPGTIATNACTAPNVVPAVTYGISGEPSCPNSSVSVSPPGPSQSCQYQINILFK